MTRAHVSCPRCRAPNLPINRFCTRCGQALAAASVTCQGCGALNARNQRFCTTCGRPLD